MKIALIGAMVEEITLLKSNMKNISEHNIAHMPFYEGKLAGHELVLAQCGVGKVNAAVCAQVLIDHFGAEAFIFTGVAGALDARINIGDFVISTDLIQHDFDVQGLGYAPGVIPDIEEWCYEADPKLRAIAHRAAAGLEDEICVFEGRIASGDQFVSSDEQKEFITSTFEALCCEMEGAAVAQVAWLNRIPFVILRAISDRADHAVVVDYRSFVDQAANRSARIVLDMLSDPELD